MQDWYWGHLAGAVVAATNVGVGAAENTVVAPAGAGEGTVVVHRSELGDTAQVQVLGRVQVPYGLTWLERLFRQQYLRLGLRILQEC